MGFTEKKARSTSPDAHGGAPSSPIKALTAEEIRLNEERKAAAMIAAEEKRMEALRKRQQDELDRIIEREKTLAESQAKLARTEEEERKRKKLHDKKVAEEKLEEEKRRAQREAELKQLEHDEAIKRRQLARKEAEVEEKLKKQHLIREREIMKRARELDEERKQKVEEARRKTEALLKLQEDLAEQNRLKMIEREARILQQLEEKKERKRQEIESQRDASLKRIEEAIHKRVEEHVKVETLFHQKQEHAAILAKENHKLELDRLKKQAQERNERNKLRFSRLVDAYRSRNQKRQDIILRREERDQVYGRIKEERDKEISMIKFHSELKLQDKLENVERVARMNEFHRLQILQKIYTEDNKYEEIKNSRDEMLRRHNDEAKNSMIRKHEITETMEKMRMTNDFTLLDKLFASRRNKKDRHGTAGGGKYEDEDGLGATTGAGGGGGEANTKDRLAQTA